MLTPIVADLSEMDALLLHQRARENGQSVGAEASFITDAARHEDSVPETGNTWTRQLIDLGQSIGGTELDTAPRAKVALLPPQRYQD